MELSILEDKYAIEKLRNTLARRERIGLSIEGCTRAGVLLILHDREGKVNLLFSRRSDSVEHHKGEISFPGGAFDAGEGDANLLDTALRETREEIGVRIDRSRIVGALDDVPTRVTNFVITPYVAHVDLLPPLEINRSEIRGVLDVPLESLMDSRNYSTEERELAGRKVRLDFFRICRDVIWGATGNIVRHLLKILSALE